MTNLVDRYRLSCGGQRALDLGGHVMEKILDKARVSGQARLSDEA